MDVRITPSAGSVAQLAADFVCAALDRPTPVVGLATGATPALTYEELVRRHREDGIDFDHADYTMLDEYVGLSPDHTDSYHYFLRQNLLDAASVPRDALHGPRGDAADHATEADRYESTLRRLGPRTIQLLGIGRDGHIGFNEPTSSLASRTRIKTLHASTRADNERFFDGGPVPEHAFTMGIGTILEADRLLLLATGTAKAAAIAAAIEGPVTAMVPASALQLHPAATIILDEDAAAALQLRDYYIATAASRPDWQRP